MRILVTGAGGFVGSRVVAALKQTEPSAEILTPNSATLDLLNCEATAIYIQKLQPTHIIHLAWVTKHGEYWTSPDNAVWVKATLNLAREFYNAGGKRFVGIGTVAEYEWTDEVLSEDSPLDPATIYGAAKLETLLLLSELTHKAKLKSGDVSMAWCRLFYLFGDGEDPRRFVASIKGPLSRGETARCENPELVRDLMSVEAAGEAIAKVALSNFEGPINICSGRGEKLGDIARRIAKELNAEDRLTFGTGEMGSPIIGDATKLRNL